MRGRDRAAVPVRGNAAAIRFWRAAEGGAVDARGRVRVCRVWCFRLQEIRRPENDLERESAKAGFEAEPRQWERRDFAREKGGARPGGGASALRAARHPG